MSGYVDGVIKIFSAFKVLVSDPIAQEGIDILEQIATVEVKTKLSEDELCAIIGDYDALMIRSGTTVTRKIIEACSERMMIIGRAGVGVDNVDVPAATERGIFVVNSPAGNTIAAAEHTLALLFHPLVWSLKLMPPCVLENGNVPSLWAPNWRTRPSVLLVLVKLVDTLPKLLLQWA